MTAISRLRAVLDERRWRAYTRAAGSPSIFLRWQPFRAPPGRRLRLMRAALYARFSTDNQSRPPSPTSWRSAGATPSRSARTSCASSPTTGSAASPWPTGRACAPCWPAPGRRLRRGDRRAHRPALARPLRLLGDLRGPEVLRRPLLHREPGRGHPAPPASPAWSAPCRSRRARTRPAAACGARGGRTQRRRPDLRLPSSGSTTPPASPCAAIWRSTRPRPRWCADLPRLRGRREPAGDRARAEREGVPGPRGGLWNASTIHGNAAARQRHPAQRALRRRARLGPPTFVKDRVTGARRGLTPPARRSASRRARAAHRAGRALGPCAPATPRSPPARWARACAAGNGRSDSCRADRLRPSAAGRCSRRARAEALRCATRIEKGACANTRTPGYEKIEARVIAAIQGQPAAPR
jgi:hypothetical protein